MSITQAVILAGGRGTRLKPLTDTTPKPMIRIHGKPFLEYLIRLLRANHITNIVILGGYLHEQIESYFGDGKKFGVTITYSIQPVEIDTGARLKHAAPLLQAEFLLLYGDNIWPLHISDLYRYYKEKKTKGLVTVYANREHTTKNNMTINEYGIVSHYDRTRKTPEMTGVDIGFFILQKNVLAHAPEENFSFEECIMTQLIADTQLAGFVTEHKYYSLSTIERMPEAAAYLTPKKVLFLDRDGVINKKAPPGRYVQSWKEFSFLPRTIDALRILKQKGYLLYIITNQAGIGRGLMTHKDVEAIHKSMLAALHEKQIDIENIFVCPHGWNDGCACRKPKPGLFFEAARKHRLNLRESYCIGDDIRDIIAGNLAGCATILLGPKGKHSGIEKPIASYPDLYTAAKYL